MGLSRISKDCKIIELALEYNMSERKTWSADEDQLLRKLLEENEGVQSEKLKWVQIAEKLAQIGTVRTGKQCRERWHNKLKPGIENQHEWTLEEEQTLFRVQEQLGNHWAQIARELPGRTDNNIKNYFYSTLRKAIRKVNSYVCLHKKDGPYRNVKQFKQFTLNKILAVAESKYQNKINLRRSGVEHDAREIKKRLVDLQRDQNIVPTHDRHPFFEDTIERILEFNRNCKRRKGKRKDSQEDDSDQSQEFAVTPNQKLRLPLESNEQLKKEEGSRQAAILQDRDGQRKLQEVQKPESEMAASQYIMNSGFVGRSTSYHKDSPHILLSSSFRQYHGAAIQQNPLFQSHNYAGNCEKGGFLSSIPNFEKKTDRSEVGFDFWREEPCQGQSVGFMMEWSGNIGNFLDDAQMRLSMSLGTSAFLQPKIGSPIQKLDAQGTIK